MLAGTADFDRVEKLNCLVKGLCSKVAAHELGISPRTIETHRARIMYKLKARNLSDVVRVSLVAGPHASH